MGSAEGAAPDQAAGGALDEAGVGLGKRVPVPSGRFWRHRKNGGDVGGGGTGVGALGVALGAGIAVVVVLVGVGGVGDTGGERKWKVKSPFRRPVGGRPNH